MIVKPSYIFGITCICKCIKNLCKQLFFDLEFLASHKEDRSTTLTSQLET